VYYIFGAHLRFASHWQSVTCPILLRNTADSADYAVASVCPSLCVRPPVTFRYCVKMATAIVEIVSL